MVNVSGSKWLRTAGTVALMLAAIVTEAARTLDYETTVAVSSSAFWRLAHSEDFYRNSRMTSRNVYQRVLNVSSWVSHEGNVKGASSAQTDHHGERAVDVRNPCGAGPLKTLFGRSAKQQLQRKVVLAYDLTSPFGTSEAKNVQSVGLRVEDGTITYSEASRVSGFPMMSGDLNGNTTFAVKPAADNPNSVLVKIAVSCDEVVLPLPVSWLKGRIGRMMRKDLLKAATSYLDAMVKAEADGRYRTDDSALESLFAGTAHA